MSYVSTIDADSPVAHLRASDASGITFVDRKGSYNGTGQPNSGGAWTGGAQNVTGALTASGDTDGAVEVNGTSGYITTALAGYLSGRSQAWMSCWIYRAATTDVMCVGAASLTASTRFGLQWYSDGNIYFAAENAGTSYGFCALTGTGWHHVGVGYDGTQTGGTTAVNNANRLKLYIDGVLKTLSFSGTIPSTLSVGVQSFDVGCRLNGTTFSKGRADELAVGGAASADFLAHYNAGVTPSGRTFKAGKARKAA